MEIQLLRLWKGYVRIRITGNSYDRFLNLCAYHNIRLWDLQPAGEAYEADLLKNDFRKLRSIIRKSHTKIKIIERHGLPFFLYRNRKRKIWLAGITAAVFFMFWLSSHIWLITIEGNVSQTNDVLFEYLDTIGIRHGMLKKEVDCRQLASDIRNYFTDFTWVSVKLNGTRLDVSVKEGLNQTDMSEEQDGGKETPSDLVAAKSGTVLSIYVRKGLPQVQAGDEVEPGTVLVSGTLPIYDDSGSVKSYQYTSSDADILIRTSVPYEDRIPFTVTKKTYTGSVKKGFLLRIGTFSAGIGSVKNTYQHSEQKRVIRQAKLFQNFYLPLYAEELEVREYTLDTEIRSKKQVEETANKNFQLFLKNLQEKGVQLFENNVRIEWYEKFCTVSGTVTVGEEAVRREVTTGGITDG